MRVFRVFDSCRERGPCHALDPYPAASFAVRSAASLPGTPTCAGTHRSWISQPRSRSVSRALTASTRMYCPEGDLGDGGLIVGNDRAIAGEVGHAMDVECNLCCQHDLSKLCVIYGGHR